MKNEKQSKEETPKPLHLSDFLPPEPPAPKEVKNNEY